MRRSFVAAWTFLTALSFVFCITLSIYPYVTTDTNLELFSFIENKNLRYAWTLQVLVTVFNVGDTVELKGKTGRKTNRCTIKLCSDETLPTILHVNTYKN